MLLSSPVNTTQAPFIRFGNSLNRQYTYKGRNYTGIQILGDLIKGKASQSFKIRPSSMDDADFLVATEVINSLPSYVQIEDSLEFQFYHRALKNAKQQGANFSIPSDAQQTDLMTVDVPTKIKLTDNGIGVITGKWNNLV